MRGARELSATLKDAAAALRKQAALLRREKPVVKTAGFSVDLRALRTLAGLDAEAADGGSR